MLATALVWGVFAAFLPLAVRGRSLTLDLARGALWAGGLFAAQLAVGDLLAAGGGDPGARGGPLGPLVGLAFALLATAVVTGPRTPRRTAGESPPADAFGRPLVA